VKGVLFTVQKALPLFRDGGSIVLNASMVASKGMPAFSVSAKMGLIGMARGLASEFAPHNIRVNGVTTRFVQNCTLSRTDCFRPLTGRFVRAKDGGMIF
jgi:NAD(P)-dependent dehydrogenase (short-subunit alcohol dehydrogenase family)